MRKTHRRIYSFPPLNATLSSEGKGTTIIIQPVSSNARDIIENPIYLAKAIKESEFGKANLKDLRTNK